MRVSILLRITVVALMAACAEKPELVAPDSPLASELKLLERQTSALKSAIADATRGELFPSGDIAVGVSEEVVQSTLAQALPLEQPVAQGFRARIERATVSFRSMQGSVTLEGRIWASSEPGTFAELILLGGIRDVEVERESGVLRADIVLDGWDVKRAAALGAESDLIEGLVRRLGDRGLSALRDLVPAVRIPVGIEDGIDLPGASGPFTIPSGHLPFDAAVSRVLPLSGRLWVMIHVTTAGWQRSALPARR
jgi:hypothetical protein